MILKTKIESFHSNATNNANIINNDDITLFETNDHSMIKNNISLNYIDEEILKSTKNEEISYSNIMSVHQNFIIP